MGIKKISNFFDIRAAIIFIVAHFASMIIFKVLVVEDHFIIDKGGFILHTLQAFVFLCISFIPMSRKLQVMALLFTGFYCLIAINWSVLERGIELDAQAYFYTIFESIVMTLNFIVICLLGKNGAIYCFNWIYMRCNLHSKVRLFFRVFSNINIYNFNLSISTKDSKSEEISK